MRRFELQAFIQTIPAANGLPTSGKCTNHMSKRWGNTFK